MKGNLTALGSILPVRVSLYIDAILAICLCLSITDVLLLAGLAYCLDHGSFEKLLVAGIKWVFPVITLKAVDMSDHFNQRRIVVCWWWWW